MKKFTLIFGFMLLLGWNARAQYTYTLLHSFDKSDRAYPSGSLINVKDTLYGMTTSGGANSYGTIFSILPGGTGFTNLHSFNGSDGAYPEGSLINISDTLYGMTSSNGADGYGNIFSIQPDGTGFTNLHSFNNTSNDGASPYGSLININDTLYGMTLQGGANSVGNIFSILPDGTGFTNLHSFSGSDGARPEGSLININDTLYGMTGSNGANGYGNIFSILPDGTGFTILHSFNNSDGAYPLGSLININDTLYGMTYSGGANSDGNIFSVLPDGTGFTNLYSFNNSDGAYPYGSLTNINGTLYGMTSLGGANNYGNVFSILPDGTGFTILYNFNNSDGAYPYGSLINIGDALYGMTYSGGANDNGVIFSLTKTAVTPVTLAGFSGTLHNGIATLQWQTGVESNFSRFVVEKSTDSKIFDTATTIAAKGSNSSYSVSIPQTAATAYYRLKMVDKDGSGRYSDIIITLSQTGNKEVTVYPNPAKDHISINVQKAGSIHIYSASGSLVKTQQLQPGINSIDVSRLGAGVYFAGVDGAKVKFVKE